MRLSQSGICVPSETKHNRELLYTVFWNVQSKIFRVKTHKYRLNYLSSTASRPRIPFRLRGIDSRCTESSHVTHARRDTDLLFRDPCYWITHWTLAPRPGIWSHDSSRCDWNTHMHLHTPGSLIALASSCPVTRERRNGADVCVSPPLPRAESLKPQNKRRPDGRESSILNAFNLV